MITSPGGLSRVILSRKGFNLNTLSSLLLEANYHLIGCPNFGAIPNEFNQMPNDENKNLSKYSGKISTFRAIWLAISSFFVLKNLIPMYYITASLSQYTSLSKWNVMQNKTELITSYGCLMTNCTTFRQNSDIFLDITFLPVFTLCMPYLKDLYSPIISLQSHGFMILAMWTSLVLMIGFLLSVYLYYGPITNDLYIFMLAPEWCRLKFRTKIKSIIKEIQLSQIHFRRSIFLNKSGAQSQVIKFYDSPIVAACCQDNVLQAKETLHFDCLPIIRSKQWKDRLLARYFKRVLISVFVYVFLSLLGILVADYKLHYLNSQLPLIEESTKRKSCSIWTLLSLDIRKPISYVGEVPQWNLILFLEFIFVCYPIFIILSVNVSHQWISLEEISVWIDEINNSIHRAIEICQLRHQNLQPARRRVDSSSPEAGQRSTLDFLDIHMVESRSSFRKLNGAYEENLANPLELSPIDSMTKVYICARLLIRFVDQTSESFSVIVVFFNLLNVLNIFLLVHYNHQFNDMQLFPAIFSITVLLLLDYMILLASSVQVRSVRMLSLIWRLIAVNANFKDMPTCHMRFLLIKLARSLSQNNGLSLQVLGFSITYTSLMKLTVWSTSLMMLLFHERPE